MILSKLLADTQRSGKLIRVALVGAGQMGEGLVCQMELMQGMQAVAVADVQPGRAAAAFRSANLADAQIVATDDLALAAQAIGEGKRVAMSDARKLCALPNIDIIVEATGVPEIGARVAWDAILARKHILQMNVETDATVGYLLRRMANAAGVVYTLTAGDEPGAAMELYDFAASLGFQISCVGKGKNNPLNRHATPETVAEKAARQQMNPKMLASFVDGSKTMVEMTSLGNGIGFVPDVRGMHGPDVTPKTLAQVYTTQAHGGVLSNTGVVEYGLGVAPGVFVIFTSQHPKIVRDLRYLSMGDGPFYALFRPYHLTSLETPVSIARAVLKHETTLATDQPPTCESFAVAKRTLRAGELIDALGGYTIYGLIDSAAAAHAQQLLPLGLAPGSRLVRDVPIDQPLTYADVELDPQLTIVQLRRMQDAMLRSD